MNKPALAAHPILDIVRARWSQRAFDAQPVAAADLLSILEAARWAPSSSNEQPWHFIVARRDDAPRFAALLACLAPSNQRWAKDAGALVLVVTRTQFVRHGKPNAHAWHDAGLALANLLLEATAHGLATHPMAGFDAAAARAAFGIPAGFDPVVTVALGHPGSLEALPEDLQAREVAPRQRRPLSEFVFEGTWGEAAPWVPAPDLTA
jgi:nitroreductase